ncbi:MAG TPA: MarR family transcriptional regulator [Ktedonobacterales bacterium]|jgi:DNA-binding MarR family transcriptional regulator
MNERQDQAAGLDDAVLLDGALITALETILPRYFRAVRHVIDQAEGAGARATNGSESAEAQPRQAPAAAGAERLTLAQFRCVQAIAAQGTTLTTHLAWQMGVTMPTMTSRIDGLVERGMVERQPDPQSRRQVLLRLTPGGQRALERYQGVVDGWLRSLLAELNAEQKRQLLAGLDDLDKLLDADIRARAEQDAAVER